MKTFSEYCKYDEASNCPKHSCYYCELDWYKQRCDELEKECFALSAEMCCAKDCGIVALEEGSQIYCKHETENKQLKENIEKMKDCSFCKYFVGGDMCSKTTCNFVFEDREAR